MHLHILQQQTKGGRNKPRSKASVDNNVVECTNQSNKYKAATWNLRDSIPPEDVISCQKLRMTMCYYGFSQCFKANSCLSYIKSYATYYRPPDDTLQNQGKAQWLLGNWKCTATPKCWHFMTWPHQKQIHCDWLKFCEAPGWLHNILFRVSFQTIINANRPLKWLMRGSQHTYQFKQVLRHWRCHGSFCFGLAHFWWYFRAIHLLSTQNTNTKDTDCHTLSNIIPPSIQQRPLQEKSYWDSLHSDYCSSVSIITMTVISQCSGMPWRNEGSLILLPSNGLQRALIIWLLMKISFYLWKRISFKNPLNMCAWTHLFTSKVLF